MTKGHIFCLSSFAENNYADKDRAERYSAAIGDKSDR
jgi:hypothetical protein